MPDRWRCSISRPPLRSNPPPGWPSATDRLAGRYNRRIVTEEQTDRLWVTSSSRLPAVNSTVLKWNTSI